MKEYILCAAIWFDDGLKHAHQPRNISTGYVICGRRHHNVYISHAIIRKGEIVPDKLIDVPKCPNEEGFMTNFDRFLDRNEAAQTAFEAGQTKERHKILFSEHLY